MQSTVCIKVVFMYKIANGYMFQFSGHKQLKHLKTMLLQASLLEGHQVYHIASFMCVLNPILKYIT
jgi:hypothetical protein